MKYIPVLLFAVTTHCLTAQDIKVKVVSTSPLANFSGEWNKDAYQACNTAKDASYMDAREKEIIYLLNLARAWPRLFATTVLARYPTAAGKPELSNDPYYYQSLIKTMQDMSALPLLYADEKCFESAACHAAESGREGYTGHKRKKEACSLKQHFLGECCDYGNLSPVDIVLSLLIDQGVPSFGHRKIVFGNYSLIGVSIQPHTTYRQNTVLDFYR